MPEASTLQFQLPMKVTDAQTALSRIQSGQRVFVHGGAWGKILRERAKQLISIAHPEDRQELERGWGELCRA